jgi:23S rRNA (adenine-N6)-dimethyltransferase
MAKRLRNGIALAQNFLKSPALVRRLIDASSIGPSDTVYEIGAGRGIITAELARTAHTVVALEKDPALVRDLKERFLRVPNVQVLEADFLQYRIPDREYKIFANIPYNLTADIVRKLLCASPAPKEANLVMQKEAAEKFSGSPKETRFSILIKPWFQLRIIRELRRTDFEPAPGVDSAFLQIRKHSPPLVREADTVLYRNFVYYGFGIWKKNLKLIFRPIFTFAQWKRLSKDLGFRLNATPTEVTFEQWLGLFDCLIRRVPRNKWVRLKG